MPNELTELSVEYACTVPRQFTTPMATQNGPAGSRWVFGVYGGTCEGPRLRGGSAPPRRGQLLVRLDATGRETSITPTDRIEILD